MGKPHPVDVTHSCRGLIEQGHTHTEPARRSCAAIEFVNDMVRLEREAGALSPKRQGNPGRGKLTDVKDWWRAESRRPGPIS